eukprot:EC714453.1.p3 GENE.EC714453.1~~EC714453.1.p3  ORF type:complete len:125 (+),score=21.68 EC714453.1:26-400(+)
MATPSAYPVGKVQVVQGAYTTGLCECCAHEGDCNICLAGWLCSCCLAAHNNANLHGYNCHCCDCCCASSSTLVPAIYFTRIQIQKLYGMPEDHCSTACTVACCTMCSNCQDAREIKYRTGRTWC